jgi:hypothetical protein
MSMSDMLRKSFASPISISSSTTRSGRAATATAMTSTANSDHHSVSTGPASSGMGMGGVGVARRPALARGRAYARPSPYPSSRANTSTNVGVEGFLPFAIPPEMSNTGPPRPSHKRRTTAPKRGCLAGRESGGGAGLEALVRALTLDPTAAAAERAPRGLSSSLSSSSSSLNSTSPARPGEFRHRCMQSKLLHQHQAAAAAARYLPSSPSESASDSEALVLPQPPSPSPPSQLPSSYGLPPAAPSAREVLSSVQQHDLTVSDDDLETYLHPAVHAHNAPPTAQDSLMMMMTVSTGPSDVDMSISVPPSMEDLQSTSTIGSGAFGDAPLDL